MFVVNNTMDPRFNLNRFPNNPALRKAITRDERHTPATLYRTELIMNPNIRAKPLPDTVQRKPRNESKANTNFRLNVHH